MSLISPTSVAAALVVALAMTAPVAHAQRKPQPACGLKFLPLIEGNTWTYEPFDMSDGSSPAGAAPTAGPLRPIPAPLVKIVVRSVAPDEETRGVTVVTLEETAGGTTRVTTLRCTRDFLDVSPQSFFFAAEPGGGRLMELQDLQRTGHTFNLRAGAVTPSPELEELKTTVARAAFEGSGAALTGGTVELERAVTLAGSDRVAVPAGNFRTSRVQFEISGRARIEPAADKPQEIPAGPAGMFWFADGIGAVQTYNLQGQMYQLVEVELK